MDREYDIFECLPDGAVVWCACASGLHDARIKLDRLRREAGKECFALHQFTREIIFAKDVLEVLSKRASKRIFQIAYSDDLRLSRAKLLRDFGYAVISAMGNEAAKFLLTTLHPVADGITLFIIGQNAPTETRTEMVDWLKTNFPTARILALNPQDQQIQNAHYNVVQIGPETWLPFVAAIVSSSQSGELK